MKKHSKSSSDHQPPTIRKYCLTFFPSNIWLFLIYSILLPVIFFLIVIPIAFSSNSLPQNFNSDDFTKFSETRALNNWVQFSNGSAELSREFGSGRNVKYVELLVRKLMEMKKQVELNSKLRMKVVRSSFLEPVQKIDNLLVILCDENTCDNTNLTSIILSSHVSLQYFKYFLQNVTIVD